MLRLVSLCGIAVLRAICFPSNDRCASARRLVGRGLVLPARPGGLLWCRDAGNVALGRFGDGVESLRQLSQDGTKWLRAVVTCRTAVVPGAPAAERAS